MSRVLAILFLLCGVTVISAQLPPPPLPSETIVWDDDYLWIVEDANGNYILWGACEGKGQANKTYYMIMYTEDKNSNVYYFGPRGGGGEKWYFGPNYDGSTKWNDFTLTVEKDSGYWKELNVNGVSTVRCKLIEVTAPDTYQLRASTQGFLFLPQ